MNSKVVLPAWLRAGLGLVLISILLIFFDIDLSPLKKLTLTDTGVLVFSSVCILFSVAFSFQLALQSMRFTLSAGQSICLSSLNAALNILLPFQAGLVMRAIYLKKVLGLGYARYAYTMGVAQIFSWLFAISLALLLSLILFIDELKEVSLLMFLGLFVLLVVLGGMYFFPNSTRVQRVLNRLPVSLDLQQFRVLLMSCSGLISIVMPVLMAVNMWFIADRMAYDIGFVSLLTISLVTHVSLFVSFTPGNIGIREGLFVFVASQIGIPAELMLPLALIDRCVFTIVVAAFGVGAFCHLKLSGSEYA